MIYSELNCIPIFTSNYLKMRTLLSSLLLLVFLSVNGQDTITVQTLDFNDITKRRGWYEFPGNDTTSYRQVLMYYTLKCDPQTTQDGYDCGEWDYSTFTNVYNYGNVGNRRYLQNGSTVDTVFYSAQEVYDYYQSYQYFTNYSGVSETSHAIGANSVILNEALKSSLATSRSQFIITAAELSGAGLVAGDIHKLSIDVGATGGQLQNLEIRMKNSALTEVTPDNYENVGLVSVYHLNTNVSPSGLFDIEFTYPFNWDGTSNLIVDLSFTNSMGSQDVELNGESLGSNCGVALAAENRCLEFHGNDYVEVPATALAALDSFITISFWSFGDPQQMPLNSYAFEGTDANGNRVVNSHLPWGNSNVYWDCGNDGTNSYDRVFATANFSDFAGEWNHWAFTKNVETGVMRVYLNGQLWLSGTNKFQVLSNIANFRIASRAIANANYEGMIDEFRIWDAELSLSEIQNYMHKPIDPSHPQYSNLLVAYAFDEMSGGQAIDYGPQNAHAQLLGLPERKGRIGGEHTYDFEQLTERPQLTFYQGTYTASLDSLMALDSSLHDMSTILVDSTFIDYNQSGLQYDRKDSMDVFIANTWSYTYDYNGQIVDSTFVSATDTLINTVEVRSHQLQNYVTPYGIGLDLGPNGFRWVYDVTDYLPILRDTIEISAGNQQELIDLKFLFIKGTPPRDVIDMETIWLGNYQHEDIALDNVMPAVNIELNPNATQYTLRTRTTGHYFGGFENCAEFCPKDHFIKVDGNKHFEWSVWKECSTNPVVDQGGTWIYDRAGWCPGTFADTYNHNLTPYVTPGSSVEIDYGMQTTAGGMEGNYWNTLQLISYGDYNHTLDAAIVDIIAPTSWEFHNRLNPTCSNPVIKIQNQGEDTLTSLTVEYGVRGGSPLSYEWNGSLAFMEEDTIELPALTEWHWANGDGSNTFEVSVLDANNSIDENPDNDIYYSKYEAPVEFPNHFYFWIQTNNAAIENEYHVIDWAGDTIFSRDNWANGTTYRDTLLLNPGCYKMILIDHDEDGMSFFANSDGNGYFRWRGVGSGSINTLENNFGDKLILNFTVGGTLDVEELDDAYVSVYPNPSQDFVNVELEGFNGNTTIKLRTIDGKTIVESSLKNVIGGGRVKFDLENQAKGVYFIQITDGVIFKTVKFIHN